MAYTACRLDRQICPKNKHIYIILIQALLGIVAEEKIEIDLDILINQICRHFKKNLPFLTFFIFFSTFSPNFYGNPHTNVGSSCVIFQVIYSNMHHLYYRRYKEY